MGVGTDEGARPAGRGTQLPKPWREYLRTGEVSNPSGNGVALNRNFVTVLESGIPPEQLGSDPSASAMTSPIVSQLGNPRNPLDKVKAPTPPFGGLLQTGSLWLKCKTFLRCFIENQGMPETATRRLSSVQGFQASYQARDSRSLSVWAPIHGTHPHPLWLLLPPPCPLPVSEKTMRYLIS